MPKPSKSHDAPPLPPKGGVRSLRQFIARSPREHLWAFLDHMDANPRLKRLLLIGLPVVALAVGSGVWGYGR